MPKIRDVIIPVHAQQDQTVRILWRLTTGEILRMEYTCPPQSVIDARLPPERRKGNRADD